MTTAKEVVEALENYLVARECAIYDANGNEKARLDLIETLERYIGQA